MRNVRISAVLIVAVILIDFVMLGRGTSSLTPALFAAIPVSFVCWRDAASPGERRLLAACTCILAAGLGVALAIATSGGASFQRTVMGLALIGAVPLAVWAVRLSGKRRRPNGIANYLDR